MQGEPWVDDVMRPLVPMLYTGVLTTGEWNRIYEAVMRGRPNEGHGLVDAIRSALLRAEFGGSLATVPGETDG